MGPILLWRGLRQCDSLSPYLFTFYVKGLSALSRKTKALGDISCVQIAQNVPAIIHLFSFFFTSDSLFLS